jgi:hypothetical protein
LTLARLDEPGSFAGWSPCTRVELLSEGRRKARRACIRKIRRVESIGC